MQNLGRKDKFIVTYGLEDIQYGVLDEWPDLKEGFNLLCGFTHGLDEEIILCDNMEDVEVINEGFRKGQVMSIKWYQGTGAGVMFNLK